MEIFNEIYKNNLWNCQGVLSGAGSHPESARDYINYILKFKDRKILDLGCGDLSLYNNNLFFKKYTGVDIVDIKKYKNLSVDIIVSPIESLKFDLYDFDLIIIKDVFQHLTNYRINNILKILSLIDVDVLITNDFNRDTFNLDCKDGDYRSLNMETDPFNCKIKSKFNWISYFDNRLKQSVLI